MSRTPRISAAALAFSVLVAAFAPPAAGESAQQGAAGPSGALEAPGGPPGGPPPGLADRDRDRVSDDFQAKLAEAAPDQRFDVIVTFAGPGNAAAAQAAVGPFRVKREFSLINGFAATMTAGQARALARTPGIFRVEEDFEVRAYLDDAKARFGIDAARANYVVSGAGVHICIVDTGIDPAQEQLDGGKVVGFCDATAGGCDVDGSGESKKLNETGPFDDHGHGTHVAAIAAGDGIAAPSGDPVQADQYKGVAPDALLLGAKVLNSAGSGTASDIIAGFDWCAGHAIVDVINASLGGLGPSDGTDSLSTAANCVADPAWVVPGPGQGVGCAHPSRPAKNMVLAAGNSGPAQDQISSPAAAEQPITVAAMGDTYELSADGTQFLLFNEDGLGIAFFSSRGPTADGRTKPDVAAPGWNVVSAEAGTTSGYVSKSGTSMAAPFVAGAIALALDANSALTPADIKPMIENAALTHHDWGSLGKDIDFGSGVFDGNAFIGAAAGDPSPAETPHLQLRGHRPRYGDRYGDHGHGLQRRHVHLHVAVRLVVRLVLQYDELRAGPRGRAHRPRRHDCPRPEHLQLRRRHAVRRRRDLVVREHARERHRPSPGNRPGPAAAAAGMVHRQDLPLRPQ
jgi:serine protease AprX